MLQRVQTLYLMGVAILVALLLFLPLSTLVTQTQELRFEAMGVYGGNDPSLLYSTWSLFVLAALISLIALATIALFKNRMLQIRLSIFNGCLLVGFYALYAFFVWVAMGKFQATSHSISFPLSFPAIAFILNWLAIRSIGADEALVRSLNRIR